MLDVIPLMMVIEELGEILRIKQEKTTIYCTVFIDNNGTLEVSKTPRMRPRTNHISLKYRYYRSYVGQGGGKVENIDNKV